MSTNTQANHNFNRLYALTETAAYEMLADVQHIKTSIHVVRHPRGWPYNYIYKSPILKAWGDLTSEFHSRRHGATWQVRVTVEGTRWPDKWVTEKAQGDLTSESHNRRQCEPFPSQFQHHQLQQGAAIGSGHQVWVIRNAGCWLDRNTGMDCQPDGGWQCGLPVG